jgi:L-alanine-DL-glutamate epimerase-like enolase superfamily enzyme
LPTIYNCGYSDLFETIGSEGTVTVPDGPGLSVEYDWDYLLNNEIDRTVYK